MTGDRAHTKVTVNLPDETVEKLRRIADEQGVTMTQVIRNAIELETFAHDEITAGGKLLVELPNGRVREVVFRYGAVPR